ncbi:MAG TPA: thioesterase family protein [Brevundimonas sp.]|jgi:acyl-CoA thioester hydrolase|uniref:acyl-CoA thioesterase n=1 Tax=Brevundimonas sp. TaxID=1871086 RepID=UPI002C9C5EA6|nr:thioesterase family protein [Brevundimonas sp.]HRH21362.1 thioesterase family protein [Brevundimonas sp.]
MSVVRPTRDQFAVIRPMPTRWADNDVYGHVNNAAYYGFFDTAVNTWLIERGLLDTASSDAIGLVIETGCRYHAALAFPETIEVAMRVETLGNSSVRYALALFSDGQDQAAADGWFVHVYVDRQTRRPVPIPAPVRAALESLIVA